VASVAPHVVELARRTGPFTFEVAAGPDALALGGVAQLLKLSSLVPGSAVLQLDDSASPTTVLVRRGARSATVPAPLLAGDVGAVWRFALELVMPIEELSQATQRAIGQLSRHEALRSVTDKMLEAKTVEQAVAALMAGVTAGQGLSLHRAVLFIPEKVGHELVGWKAVGPADQAEAHHIWESLEERGISFERALAKAGAPSKLEGIARMMRLSPGTVANDEVALALAGTQLVFERPDGPVASGLKRLDPAREFVLARLTAREHLLGLLFADRKYGEGRLDAELRAELGGFVSHAALVWETLRLLKENEELARHDPLTGLLNRRELESRLTHERSRAQRAKTPLAFLLIDLDHFRDANNVRGHEAGDAILRTIGHILKEELRAHDVAARFGGDEFGIVLPGAGSLEAALVARRIGEAAFRKDISLSIGASSFPDDTDHPDDLVSIADKNLYAAKSAGRGRACLSPDGEPIVFGQDG
jgi:diguanylate cyclase (GGDEF)-like protein